LRDGGGGESLDLRIDLGLLSSSSSSVLPCRFFRMDLGRGSNHSSSSSNKINTGKIKANIVAAV
jgi:hypothetical protein